MPANVHNILPSWAKNTPLSRIPLFRFCQIVRNILHTATGIDRGNGPGSRDGLGWHFGPRPESFGIPADCDKEDVTIYCKEFKLTAKLNSKTDEEDNVTYYGLTDFDKVAYNAADARLLLQIVSETSESGTVNTLKPDKGYLKS